MNRVGKVLEVYGEKQAKIIMRRHTACGDCGACQHGKEKLDMEVVAINEIGAQVGDTVEINMRVYNVLTAAFIVYAIPLAMLILGVISGNIILKNMGITSNIELYSMLIGLFLLIVTYIFLKLYENRLKKEQKYIPIISKIVQ